MNNVLEVKQDDVELLKVMSHPVRIQIVSHLTKNGKTNVTELVGLLDLPQSTISQHLTKLKTTKIVQAERRGLEVYYCTVSNKANKIVSIVAS
ncbi:transcriptional regulator [Bacillus toyonensis]|uniref:ArsR/SmtB family transcription factor n=1 Tax=Bacillus cereus group TaxID=86661 RepID=UPI000BF9BC62|nr:MULTISPECIES: metalloregulator ArsR/SmtB family transcription factor [Bacillus cereus group]PEQ70051.1 transcriptional regulator [Bacillus thuringiensis]PHD31307.1 transcriptional regulator [Bacillus toyonensis]